jgi:hypothetical protein
MTTAILEFRPAATPGAAPRETAATDLVRLFALDRIATARRSLVCHWHRGADGRLVRNWEPDIGPFPNR